MTEPEIRPMWLIDIRRPWRRPSLSQVEIRHGKTTVRGVAPNGRAFFYGVSMFGTRDAADRECCARMESYAADWYNQRLHWDTVAHCRALLAARKNSQ